jgi:phosphonopyruvate decarboxylase
MIKPSLFYNLLKKNGIEFFTGVPDSLLKDICAYITENTDPKRNIIAANEGNSIALAAGHYLATGNISLVYMQNSGIGNAVNPLLSLADNEVYSIPMLLMIGWRGEPGIKDEPQHIKQGKVTLDLLNAMGIKYEILPDNVEGAGKIIQELIVKAEKSKSPTAFIVKKGTFDKFELIDKDVYDLPLSREDAIDNIVNFLSEKDIVVSTTGKASRELFEIRSKKGQGHQNDFLTVGSMGHANQIALGIALEKVDRNVYCLDGDGAVLMHTGGMGVIGDLAPSNYKHIVLNNGSHESVGGQPTLGFKVSFEEIAKSFKYKNTFTVSNYDELKEKMQLFIQAEGPALIEVKVAQGSRKDLGRPTKTPIHNKEQFMRFIQE